MSFQSRYATGAIAMGVPGWPEFAACTASIERVRIVLILRWSISAGDDISEGLTHDISFLKSTVPIHSTINYCCQRQIRVAVRSSRCFEQIVSAGATVMTVPRAKRSCATLKLF